MSTEVQSNSSTDEVSLAAAFTAEHHDIDAGIEQYLADTAAPDPRQRAVPLQNAMAALRSHIYLEEEIVFPHLPKGALMMPLIVMRKEHGEIWQRMDADLTDQEQEKVLKLLAGGEMPKGWVCEALR
ncbi:hemerythrin domain-containing protein [Corynebacterium stationis]|uniref:Hemerythrin domain-containing protein n=1 Tax=Corynebacterium stationis TaxID=1705 RepID=A0AB36CKP4_9CORY|nr:hemerythrin domain-containing protein [Corynebacterium stationis]NME89455.1 hemerythrin domain-containing protein [Corynebacterium stationis]